MGSLLLRSVGSLNLPSSVLASIPGLSASLKGSLGSVVEGRIGKMVGKTEEITPYVPEEMPPLSEDEDNYRRLKYLDMSQSMSYIDFEAN